MTDPAGEESVRVQLARMEGKLDLSNLRHEQTDAWKVTVDQRLHRHSNDISTLQAAEHLRAGERKGIVTSGRLIGWTISGLAGTGLGAALLKAFGA